MISKDPEFYVKGVLEGDRRVLAKTITLIESALPQHQEMAEVVIDRLMPSSGGAVRLGLTGVPGVGKSTFIEALGMMLVEMGHRPAVLAVDPSSTRTGGSILADKTRMERLSTEKRAFIRPSPSGGTLGGVAKKTRETMLVCEAAGYDVLIIETVGVGQSETTVASMVDFFLVLMLAGAGDEIQGIKKGVLELADALAINKADGDNIERAMEAKAEYEKALRLIRPATPTWTPVVVTCSALLSTGIREIWEIILEHQRLFKKTGELYEKRRRQAVDWMWALVEDGLKQRFLKNREVAERLPKLIKDVEQGVTSPGVAAHLLLNLS